MRALSGIVRRGRHAIRRPHRVRQRREPRSKRQTTTELTNRPSGAGGFNATLEPQKATNYEIGVRGDVAGRLNYSVALFDAEVRDELSPSRSQGTRRAGSIPERGQGSPPRRGARCRTRIRSGLDSSPPGRTPTSATQLRGGGERARWPGDPGHPAALAAFSCSGVGRRSTAGWVEVEETHSSGYLVATRPRLPRALVETNLRVGWTGGGSCGCVPSWD